MGIPLGKRVQESLNKQVSEEFGIAYTYLSMSSVFSDMGLNGGAKWTLKRSREKVSRAMLIYNYIFQRGVKVKFGQLPAPKQDWRAPLHILEEMLRIEQKSINNVATLYEFAVAEKDYPSQSFFMSIMDMQVSEEMLVVKLLERLRRMQTSDTGVLEFDHELEKLASE
jgi:ferritin